MSKSIITFLKKKPEENPTLQKSLEGRITMLKEIGSIEKIATPINTLEYKTTNTQYNDLVKNIKSSNLPKEIRNNLSFELNKCQAIIAFRADDKKSLSTYLKVCDSISLKACDSISLKACDSISLKACDSISASRNDFITELHKVLTGTQEIAEIVKKNIQTTLYSPLLQQAFNAADSHLVGKSPNYTAAYNEIDVLLTKCNTSKILAKYVTICIEEGTIEKLEECWATCDRTVNNSTKKDKVLSKLFEDLQKELKSVSDKSTDDKLKLKYEDLANKAGERAQQYAPQVQENAAASTSTPAPVSKDAQKLVKAAEKLEEQSKKIQTQLITTKAQVAEIGVEEQIQAALKVEEEKLRAKYGAIKTELKEQIKIGTESQLQAIQGQVSPIIVKNPLVQPSAPPIDPTAPPPSYAQLSDEQLFAKLASSPHLKLAIPTNTTTTPTTTNLSAAQLLEQKVAELLNSDKPDAMDQAIVLCDKAIADCDKESKSYSTTYKDIEDLKVLEILASRYLTLNNPEKANDMLEAAKEICHKIMVTSEDAYTTIKDIKVLDLFANLYSEQGAYDSCIKSCKQSYELSKKFSPENYPLLKKVGENAINEVLAMEALKFIEPHATTPTQQAELCLYKAKIYYTLGENGKAKVEYKKAFGYDKKIHKTLDDTMLRFLNEYLDEQLNVNVDITENAYYRIAKYCCLSKLHQNNPNDLDIINKLIDIGTIFKNNYGNLHAEATCLMKAYRFSHNPDLLPTIKRDLKSISELSPKLNYFSTYESIIREDITKLDIYFATITGEIECAIDYL